MSATITILRFTGWLNDRKTRGKFEGLKYTDELYDPRWKPPLFDRIRTESSRMKRPGKRSGNRIGLTRKEHSFWVPFCWNKCEGVKRSAADKRAGSAKCSRSTLCVSVNRRYPDPHWNKSQWRKVHGARDEIAGMPRLADGIRVKAMAEQRIGTKSGPTRWKRKKIFPARQDLLWNLVR